MGSDSDLPILQKSIDTLKSLDIPYEVHVYSAHRTPVEARDFSFYARERGFGVLIAAAGMAAHLAGAVAANTTLPVIGIPCKSSNLDGLDALLSTVQMPTGIPVATVAINGGANAAILAAQILAVSDAELAAKLDAAIAGGEAVVYATKAPKQAEVEAADRALMEILHEVGFPGYENIEEEEEPAINGILEKVLGGISAKFVEIFGSRSYVDFFLDYALELIKKI
jgi:5-(carboxyamino)imidazole ribonucleotide mutase